MTSFDCESGGGRWYEETLSPCERFWVCLALSHSEDVGKNASHVALARGLTEGTLVPKSIKTYFETLPGRRVGVHSTRRLLVVEGLLSRAGGTSSGWSLAVGSPTSTTTRSSNSAGSRSETRRVSPASLSRGASRPTRAE